MRGSILLWLMWLCVITYVMYRAGRSLGFNNNKIRENEYRNITQIYYMYVISKKYIHNFLNIFPLQIQFNRENIVLVGRYIDNLSHLWLDIHQNTLSVLQNVCTYIAPLSNVGPRKIPRIIKYFSLYLMINFTNYEFHFSLKIFIVFYLKSNAHSLVTHIWLMGLEYICINNFFILFFLRSYKMLTKIHY